MRYNTYRDKDHLYLLLEAGIAGDLNTIVGRYNMYGFPFATYYSAIAIEALLHMHGRKVVYGQPPQSTPF